MSTLPESDSFCGLTPDAILDAVETTGVRCDGRFLALNSYENRVYQIGVDAGSPLVAKFYRANRWSNEAIIEEHRFTVALAQQELPVIPPIADQSGNSLHSHNGFRFSLYPCRGGRSPELDNVDSLEQLGRLIARIHALGSTASFQHRATLDIQRLAVRPSLFLLDNGFIPEPLAEAYRTLIDHLIEQVQCCFERAGDVHYLRLHGDCHPGNILWTDDGPHMVDFDDAHMGPAVEDLWMFLSGGRDYMTARLGDLLAGYSQFFDFDSSELHLIEALRTLRMIHYAGWLGARWDDPAFPRAFPWFNTARYWDQHILALREQAALMHEPPLSWD